MEFLETVSQLDPEGYFCEAVRHHNGLLPNGAVNIAPPKLKPYEAAKINKTKDGWIIEEDLSGLHAPFFDFNEAEQQLFVFDESFKTYIPTIQYSLIYIRALTRHFVHKVQTADGDRFFKFRGMETQNRLLYLNNNLKIISKETVDAYTLLYKGEYISNNEYIYLLYKTKFGIEQSVYCMKLSFDYLVQIACYFLFQNIEIDSLGSFLKLWNKGNEYSVKINELIFKRYNDKNYDFLRFLNNSANCYKHSYLQAFADNLYGEEVPIVTNVHLDKKKIIKVYNGYYLQLIYAFHASMAEAMNAIEESLPESTRQYFSQLKSNSTDFI